MRKGKEARERRREGRGEGGGEMCAKIERKQTGADNKTVWRGEREILSMFVNKTAPPYNRDPEATDEFCSSGA